MEFFEQAAEEVLQFGVVGVGEAGPDAVAFGGDEGLDFADEGFAFGGEAQEDLAAVAVVAAAFAPYPAARGHFVGQATISSDKRVALVRVRLSRSLRWEGMISRLGLT